MKTNATLVFFAWAFLCAPATQADSFGSGATQFDIEFVEVGEAGNTADSDDGDINRLGIQNLGSVAYGYRIGKFEISEDAITKANALGGLGITQDNRGVNKPATSVNWFEAAKFVNWLNTSRGHQAAYNFDSGGNFQLWSTTEAWQLGGENLFRHKDAFYFLPSADEWYKAAYYDPATGLYYDYPTGSDNVPDGIDFEGDTLFDAVFTDGALIADPNDVSDVGVLSPFGTAGQGGNAMEWEETELDLMNDASSVERGFRGGWWDSPEFDLRATNRDSANGSFDISIVGFRVASRPIPEPSTLLMTLGVTGGLLVWRRRRRA